MTYVPVSEKRKRVFEEYENLKDGLSNYIEKTAFKNWDKDFQKMDPDHIDNRLDKFMIVAEENADTFPSQNANNNPLFIRTHGLLESNFDKALLQLIYEVKYWDKLKTSGIINTNIHAIQNQYSDREKLRKLREYVMLVVGYYNEIYSSIDHREKRIFCEHLKKLNDVIAPGIKNYKWSASENIANRFVEQCRIACSELYQKVQTFKKNTRDIHHEYKKISETMLLEIDKKKIYVLKDFIQAQEIVRQRKMEEFRQSFSLIREKLKGIYKFFFKSGEAVQSEYLAFIEIKDKELFRALRSSVRSTLIEFSRTITGDSKNDPVPIFRIYTESDLTALEWNIAHEPSHDVLKEAIQKLIGEINAVTKVVDRLEKVFIEDRKTMLEAKKKKELEKNKAAASQKVAQRQTTKMISFDNADKDKTRGALPKGYVYKERSRFFDNIAEDEGVKDKGKQITDAVESIKEKLESVIKEWQNSKFKDLYRYRTERGKRRLVHDTSRTIDSDPTLKYSNSVDTVNTLCGQALSIIITRNEKFVQIDPSKLKQKLIEFEEKYQDELLKMLYEEAKSELHGLYKLFEDTVVQLTTPPQNRTQLKRNMDELTRTTNNLTQIEMKIKPIEQRFAYLQSTEFSYGEEEQAKLANLKVAWVEFKDNLDKAQNIINKEYRKMKSEMESSLDDFEKEIQDMQKSFEKNAPKSTVKIETAKAKSYIQESVEGVKSARKRELELKEGMTIFNMEPRQYKGLIYMEKELQSLTEVWDLKERWDKTWNVWRNVPFRNLEVQEMAERADQIIADLQDLNKEIREWPIYDSIKKLLEHFRDLMPIITCLLHEAMKSRHWEKLFKEVKEDFDPDSAEFTLEKVYKLKLNSIAEFIDQLTDEAQKDLALENELKKIKHNWDNLSLCVEREKGNKISSQTTFKVNVGACENLFQVLEEDVARLANMKSSSSIVAFETEVDQWETDLAMVSDTVELLINVQKQWSYLGNILYENTPLSRQVAEEKSKFTKVNTTFSVEMSKIYEEPNALQACSQKGFYEILSDLNETLETIQKALNQNLFKVRTEFPRFYFLSNDDLLEMIAKSTMPHEISKHFKKCFEGIYNLEYQPIQNKQGAKQLEIIAMKSEDGEIVKFHGGGVIVVEQIENWMKHLQDKMEETLKKDMLQCANEKFSMKMDKADNIKIEKWLKNYYGQLLITASQLAWTSETQKILHELESAGSFSNSNWQGPMGAHKRYLQRLVQYVRTDCGIDRLKLMPIITIEVHHRDVREYLIAKRVESVSNFEWQKQLRFERIDDNDTLLVTIKQTNTKIPYGYEYQGNNGRLVVTPLTDRCYITLTTALFLRRGGAPQGPAGTGKTETVKDLGKALAKLVLVFNCSDSLDEKSLGRMISGLAETGAWGCFDEFNRIEIEVLSVVAQYISLVLDALRNEQKEFVFETNRKLNTQVGIFITMNPGYAGRTELPDNLKSLFRPVSMMVPDFELIGENILMAEGFSSREGKKDAKEKEGETHKDLARKVVTIYRTMQQQLSKQDHYDFGMRAVKSVLTFAGNLRRERTSAGSTISETVILMQAIHDMNMPKLISEDIPLFVDLLRDLFPRTELPEPENDDLLEAIEAEMKEMKLQLNPIIAEKTLQLFDSKNTRHGNMLVGQTLSGKSTCWKLLEGALNRLKGKKEGFNGVRTYIMNPKAITIDELFGSYNMASEWSDGILTTEMKNACNDIKPDQKWLILDGPIDTLWIESMNSLLDDNKILTLITGDRVALTREVSLLFEIENLAVASPATVSRAGMIYLDVNDLGWKSYVDSWIAQKEDEEVRSNLEGIVEKYLNKVIQVKRLNTKDIVTCSEISTVISMCHLFDAIMPVQSTSSDKEEMADGFWTVFEKTFCFALVWSVGATVQEKYRRELDLILRDIESIFPIGSIFDFGIDEQKGEWVSWEEKLSDSWKIQEGTAFHSIQVPTIDTLRMWKICEKLHQARRNILLIGNTGNGKTAFIQGLLHYVVDESQYYHFNLLFSAQTSSSKTQEIIESKFEKRGKNKMLPPYGRKAICFVDDLNMPRKDQYGSQPPLELLRQWMDYSGWYDRTKQSFKYILDMQLISAMGPPGGGRAEISQRFQSGYHIINFSLPSEKQLIRIFQKIGEFKLQSFDDEEIKQLSEPLAQATLNLFNTITENFKPTPTKSHYVFNLRDISKVFQGLHRADKNYYETKEAMLKLWTHEVLRVFADRLINDEDRNQFKELLNEQLDYFSLTYNEVSREGEDSIFVDFLHDDIEVYQEAKDLDALRNHLQEKLKDYNSESRVIPMNLVLFHDAIFHTCKIYRILKLARGNAMLVGVGGSGRHSLTKLATYLASMKSFQLEITRAFNVGSFREYLKNLFDITGVKKRESVFIFSDNDILDESFIEDVNNILSAGEIPNLYGQDELQQIRDDIKKEFLLAKPQSVDTIEAIYEFFVSRVRDRLHLVLCMSPIGKGFLDYCRMYPALVNNTTINWFMKWPEDALREVAQKFVKGMEFAEELHEGIADCFTFMHLSVEETALRMRNEIKRVFYVTPTNYIELMNGYKKILHEKRTEIGEQIEKLRNGLQKLDDAHIQVQQMTQDSESKKSEKSKKHKTCEELMGKITLETSVADEKLIKIQEATERIDKEKFECDRQLQEAMQELAKAEPALIAAAEALGELDKKTIAEVKAYQKPPPDVMNVMSAVMIIFERSPTWSEVKKQLADPNFLQKVKEFKPEEQISKKTLNALEKYTRDENFQPHIIKVKSLAAGILCIWVRAIEDYVKAHRMVEPKRAKRDYTLNQLRKKEEALQELMAEFKQIQDRINELKDQYKDVSDEMAEFARQVDELQAKIERGETMIGDLSSEKTRWERQILEYKQQYKKLIGDCLGSAAFIVYCGPFTSQYRDEMNEQWINKIKENEILISEDYEFTKFMVGEGIIRNWVLDGLPTDKFSAQNGVMVKKGDRWPLIIDPQNQAKNWISNSEGRKLEIANKKIRSNYLAVVKKSIKYGKACLIPDVGEEIDPDLEPVLNKSVKKQLDRMIIKVGKDEIEYNNKFKLYITTNISNPHYTPEITTKVTLVNFQVKESGLEEQLLDKVFAKEESTFEKTKNNLVQKISESKTMIKDLEDKILKLLKESKVALLDDLELIEALKTSKETADEVKQALEYSEQNMKKIEMTRDKYRHCAQKASILYFVLDDLAKIDPMYQFSLEWYMNLFTHSITESSESGIVDSIEERVQAILKHHKEDVYKKACRSLFEKHKLLLSLQIVVKLQLTDADMEEWNFFLKGGTVLDRKDQSANPAKDWISQNAWDNICELDKLTQFGGIIAGMLYNTKEWKKWYLTQRPENENLPGEWETKCEDSLRKMIILRCLRPDRMILKAQKFVEDHLSAKFIDNKPVSLLEIYNDSTPITPIIFVLSPGVDPLDQLLILKNQVKQTELVNISLGQGQSARARAALSDATQKGSWVYFANCHLALSWLTELESLIENLPKANPVDSFRLFLSSSPHPKFPIGILQKSVKMTTEPPKGIKANMMKIYNNLPQDKEFITPNDRNWYAKTIWGLAWFHSILVERKKFKTLGWNVLYDFNDSDFSVCENLIEYYAEKSQELSKHISKWPAIQELISEANYGGRVTDEFDRKLIKIYAEEIFTEHNIINLGIKPGTKVGQEEEKNEYQFPEGAGIRPEEERKLNPQMFVDELEKRFPNYDLPKAFGQHVNAEISSQITVANELLDCFMMLTPVTQTQASKSEEHLTQDEHILKIIADLSEILPENFDVEDIKYRWRNDYDTALKVVLFQETSRYNVLLTKVRLSLETVGKCIAGQVVISPAIEKITNSLAENRVPAAFLTSYPSVKPLADWFRDLKDRIAFFRDWSYKGQPSVFNISAFTYPTGFTTALFQKYARKFEFPIDSLFMDFQFPPEKATHEKAKDGAYITGLYLEGAKWSVEENCLIEPQTMKLHELMPVMHFKPAQKRKKEAGKANPNLFYQCPCYYYPTRKAVNGKESYMLTINLKTGTVLPMFWAKRGTALLMSLAE